MKRIILITIFVFLMCSFSSAQSPLPELEKAKGIKILETSREEVRKIFAGYISKTSDDSKYLDEFATENAEIDIFYSSGICSEDIDEVLEWNVPKWRVTNVTIFPQDSIKIQDIGIDFSKYRKERIYADYPNAYIYHNKDLGIAFKVDENEIEDIYLVPNKKDFSLSCNQKTAKKYTSSKSWFIDSKLKDRVVIIDKNNRPKVVNLILSADEIIENGNTKIAVLVSAIDPENDVLGYYYEVSGGKIIRQSSNVVWDLSGEKPGTYTITAGADDGCGKCGNTMTKTVTIKECPDCQ